MSKQSPKNVYEFKITLKEIKPKIYRKIQVPETYNFWDLHVAIQDSMGWEDYHLHQFDMDDPKTGEKVSIGIPDEDGMVDYHIIPGVEAKITKYFLSPKDKALYEYDFGDGWEHEVVLEKILPSAPGVKYPRCTHGARACPPEDCGGYWGYQELLEIMTNPDDPDYAEKMEWLGGEFDPEEFEVSDVHFDSPKKRYKVAFG